MLTCRSISIPYFFLGILCLLQLFCLGSISVFFPCNLFRFWPSLHFSIWAEAGVACPFTLAFYCSPVTFCMTKWSIFELWGDCPGRSACCPGPHGPSEQSPMGTWQADPWASPKSAFLQSRTVILLVVLLPLLTRYLHLSMASGCHQPIPPQLVLLCLWVDFASLSVKQSASPVVSRMTCDVKLSSTHSRNLCSIQLELHCLLVSGSEMWFSWSPVCLQFLLIPCTWLQKWICLA